MNYDLILQFFWEKRPKFPVLKPFQCFYMIILYPELNLSLVFTSKVINIDKKKTPSIRDRVQWKKILALKNPVFSTFSNFFKKIKKNL